jgi:hypothetical protein
MFKSLSPIDLNSKPTQTELEKILYKPRFDAQFLGRMANAQAYSATPHLI